MTRTRLFAPHPTGKPEPDPVDEGPSVKDKYLEFLKGFRPMRSDFHDRLADAAGLGVNEEGELEQLVLDWKRLKRGR